MESESGSHGRNNVLGMLKTEASGRSILLKVVDMMDDMLYAETVENLLFVQTIHNQLLARSGAVFFSMHRF